jgi:hypothetical protein
MFAFGGKVSFPVRRRHHPADALSRRLLVAVVATEAGSGKPSAYFAKTSAKRKEPQSWRYCGSRNMLTAKFLSQPVAMMTVYPRWR